MHFILTGGEVSDFSKAVELLSTANNEKITAVLADKGYDADYVVEEIEKVIKAEVVIPPKSNRKVLRY